VSCSAVGYPLVQQPWVAQLVELSGAELVAVLAMVVLLAPIGEEVFFRGYLQEALANTWGQLGSLLLTSAAFAGVHAHGPALPACFLEALGLGLAARRAGLMVPIVAHVTVNGLALVRLWYELG